MSKNNTLVPVAPMGDDDFEKKSLLNRLMRDKRDYVQWVHKNIKSESLRRYAIETGAYHFINEYYDYLVYAYRRRIESLYDFKIRLLEHHKQRQAKMAIEQEKLQLTLTELASKRAKIVFETRRLLTPPDTEKDQIEQLRLQDRKEFLVLKQQQSRRRAIQQAVMADATERALIRTRFEKQLQEEFGDDTDLIQQALDEFDRAMYANDNKE